MNYFNMFQRLLFYKLFRRLPVLAVAFIVIFLALFGKNAFALQTAYVDMEDFLGSDYYTSIGDFTTDYKSADLKSYPWVDFTFGSNPLNPPDYVANWGETVWFASFTSLSGKGAIKVDQVPYFYHGVNSGFATPALVIQCFESDNHTPCNDALSGLKQDPNGKSSLVPMTSSKYTFLYAPQCSTPTKACWSTVTFNNGILHGDYTFDPDKIYRLGLLPAMTYSSWSGMTSPNMTYSIQTASNRHWSPFVSNRILKTFTPSPFFPDNFSSHGMPFVSNIFTLIIKDGVDPDEAWKVLPYETGSPSYHEHHNPTPTGQLGVVFTRPTTSSQPSGVVRFSGSIINTDQAVSQWDSIVMLIGDDPTFPYDYMLSSPCSLTNSGQFLNGLPVWVVPAGCTSISLPLAPPVTLGDPFDFVLDLSAWEGDFYYLGELYSTITGDHMIDISYQAQQLISDEHAYGHLVIGATGVIPDDPSSYLDPLTSACSFSGLSVLDFLAQVPQCVKGFVLWLFVPQKTLSDYWGGITNFYNGFLLNDQYLVGTLIAFPKTAFSTFPSSPSGSITPVVYSFNGIPVTLFDQNSLVSINTLYPWFKKAVTWSVYIFLLFYISRLWRRVLTVDSIRLTNE